MFCRFCIMVLSTFISSGRRFSFNFYFLVISFKTSQAHLESVLYTCNNFEQQVVLAFCLSFSNIPWQNWYLISSLSVIVLRNLMHKFCFFLRGFLQTFVDPSRFDVFIFKNVLPYGNISIIDVSHCSQKLVINLIYSSIKINMSTMKQGQLFIEINYVAVVKNSFFYFYNTFPKPFFSEKNMGKTL